jgi:PPOX class probable F420-dependent enzyme
MARKIATNTTVTKDELISFVKDRHEAVLITRRPDGWPQVSPVTLGVDDLDRLVIASYPTRAKSKNLRKDAAATVCVLSDDFGGPWVQIDGYAEVIDVPAAVEPLVTYYRNIAGDHPDWDEYRQAMLEQGKCIIRITIDRWGPIATGGFPPHLA